VRPRRESPETLIAQALLRLWCEGRLPAPGAGAEAAWPGLAVRIHVDEAGGEPGRAHCSGRGVIRWARESGADEHHWSWEPPAAGNVPQGHSAQGHSAQGHSAGGHSAQGHSAGGHSAGGDPLSGCIRLGGGGGKCVPASYLAWGKRQALAFAWARRAENDLWERQLAETRLGAHLFLPYREGQTTQGAAECWGRLWSALCWQWIVGETPAGRDLLDFLVQRGEGHPDRTLLSRRVGALLAEMVGEAPLDCRALRAVLERAAAVNLQPDLARAQNIFWTRWRDEPAARDAALALGFA
jgi:hypothetical protein